MTPSSLVREKALLEVIRQGFLVSSRSQTHAMLGDRTSYVGMSDVGKYLECPRAAVASRIFPEPETLIACFLCNVVTGLNRVSGKDYLRLACVFSLSWRSTGYIRIHPSGHIWI